MKTLIRISPFLLIVLILSLNQLRHAHYQGFWTIVLWILAGLTLIPVTMRIRQQEHPRWVLFFIGVSASIIITLIQYFRVVA